MISNSDKHDFWILLNSQFIIVFVCIFSHSQRQAVKLRPRTSGGEQRSESDKNLNLINNNKTSPVISSGYGSRESEAEKMDKTTKRRSYHPQDFLSKVSQGCERFVSEARSSIYEDKRAFSFSVFISYLLSQERNSDVNFLDSRESEFWGDYVQTTQAVRRIPQGENSWEFWRLLA